MGRKQILKPYKVIADEDMSVNIDSVITNVEQLDSVKYVLEWSTQNPLTPPQGELKLFARLNQPQETPATTQWVDVTGQTITVTGAIGTHTIDVILTELRFTEFYLAYVATSGIGVLSATIYGSTQGA